MFDSASFIAVPAFVYFSCTFDTGKFAVRNIYAKCKTEDDDCLELFQKRGGMVCVCGKSIDSSAEGFAKLFKSKKETLFVQFKKIMGAPSKFRL